MIFSTVSLAVTLNIVNVVVLSAGGSRCNEVTSQFFVSDVIIRLCLLLGTLAGLLESRQLRLSVVEMHQLSRGFFC